MNARPGGRVPGIGWVASWDDLSRDDEYEVRGESYLHPGDDKRLAETDELLLVRVTRWADGEVPTEPDGVLVPRAEWDALVEAVDDEAKAEPGYAHLAASDNVCEAADALVAAVRTAGGES